MMNQSELMKRLQFVAMASKETRRPGPASSQLKVLMILAREDGVVQSYLADILNLRPSSMAELLKKLEVSGDITREEDAADKRIKRVYITDQGLQRMMNEYQEERSDIDFFAGLDAAEQEQFRVYLDKIVAGWPAELKENVARYFDPMERMAMMQKMRSKMPGGFHEMSNSEKREFKKKMRKEMWQMRFGKSRPASKNESDDKKEEEE